MLTSSAVKRFFKSLDRIANPPLDFIPRKVLITSTCLDLTGAQRQLTNTAIEIKKRLQSPMSILFAEPPNPKAHLLVQDLKHHNIELSVLSSASTTLPLRFSPLGDSLKQFPPQDQKMIATFYSIFMKERPEIIHSWGMATGAIVAVAGLMAGIPRIIISWRGMSPQNKSWGPKNSFCHNRDVYRQLLRYPQIKLMANSQLSLEDYAQWIKCSPQRFHMVHNALNINALERFPAHNLKEELKIPRQKKILGGMFRFHPDKNPELWVETAKVLSQTQKNLVFVVAGEGDLMGKIQKMIKDYELEDRFFLLGRYVNVKAFYESLDCFLLTSCREGEGLPNVLIEAQYFGIPTVTTNGGGQQKRLMREQAFYAKVKILMILHVLWKNV